MENAIIHCAYILITIVFLWQNLPGLREIFQDWAEEMPFGYPIIAGITIVLCLFWPVFLAKKVFSTILRVFQK